MQIFCEEWKKKSTGKKLTHTCSRNLKNFLASNAYKIIEEAMHAFQTAFLIEIISAKKEIFNDTQHFLYFYVKKDNEILPINTIFCTVIYGN